MLFLFEPFLFETFQSSLVGLIGLFGLTGLLPICQPQDLKVLTILGVMAAVRGTRTKMKLLWIAYARASWVARPFGVLVGTYQRDRITKKETY